MASIHPLRLHPGIQRTPLKYHTLPIPLQLRETINPSFFSPKSPKISAYLPSADSSWEREELRWRREEQRWLREEQRWLREESRWKDERQSIIREIAALRLRINAFDSERPSVSGAKPSMLDCASVAEESNMKEVVLEEVRVENKKKRERKTLRKGSEGEDVREIQEALLKLGFYSGEEDLEYSSFSNGTERAVKTWQASLGIPEDGILTGELLERLLLEQVGNAKLDLQGDSVFPEGKVGVNGAVIASVREVAEIQETVIQESSDSEIEVSQQRVFLLGENRWEEPSRLASRNKPIGSKAVFSIKCISCRGEGKLMCTGFGSRIQPHRWGNLQINGSMNQGLHLLQCFCTTFGSVPNSLM